METIITLKEREKEVKMKIWYVSAESYPFIKTGGLGDVSYAFPRALSKIGVKARVILPFFYTIPEKYTSQMVDYLQWSMQLGSKNYQVIVKQLRYGNIDYFFIAKNENPDNKLLSIYSNYTNAFDFMFFSKAIIRFLEIEDEKPEILHLNDWHTGLIALLLKMSGNSELSKIKVIFTIHNLQYQGQFGAEHVLSAFGWEKNKNVIEKTVSDGVFSFMKTGIVYSDRVTTVSPTYMLEIQGGEFGMGLDGLLREHSSKLSGILNGLDTEIYSPSADEFLKENYDENTWERAKKVNKKFLQEKSNLEVSDSKFVVGIVSRLANQKGFDIFDLALPILQNENPDIQFVILGTGDKVYENNLARTCHNQNKNCTFINDFSEEFAHQIYAGSDAFLVPSYFEPCGLTQLISLKYGSVPIVRKTGGLADTVIDIEKPNATGFNFEKFSVEELVAVVKKAENVFQNDKKRWTEIVNAGIRSRFSWDVIAEQYLELYKQHVAK
ncbi:glycogen synthase [Mycoplasmopsis agassizii]|uniref:Glycogen synthase n=1 Tax=Mycoplasmopsis agassizii TaxID=33922 RepID=A0ABX4H6E2_9BACT|nr:glycogen/starch synthase [Mycoplasmopsis agassizii]PAF55436.1 glycogen synthase [Mycoplasmopsis agassizii]SMC18420.1 starch synthase [Mycoplasmopsis agassizii]